jgi:hypothetical protein
VRRPAGVATAMRPIDVCTPKPFQLEHSCFVVSQRGSEARPTSRDAARGTALFPTASRLPCSFRRMSLSPRARTSEEARSRASGNSGPPIRRGWGERRFTTGLPLRRSVGALERRDSSSASGPNPITSGISVASSFPGCLPWARVSSSTRRWSGGRQDRFRASLVKAPRFADPRCLPPVAAARNPPEPKPGRTRVASCECNGAHVMRIAAPRWTRPPFAADDPERLHARRVAAGQAPVHALLCTGMAFDQSGAGGALL